MNTLPESDENLSPENTGTSYDDDDEVSQSTTECKSTAEPVQTVAPIIAKETRALLHSRVMVGMILLITGAVAGMATYLITTRGQENNFDTQFTEMAGEVIAFSEASFQSIGGILATMSSSMTAFSLGQGTQWPYYTHIDYEVFGQSVLSTSGAQMVSWSPIVTGEVERDIWGAYSTENDAWVEEGLELRVANEGITMPAGPLDVPPEIYRRNSSGKSVVETGWGPFVPVWQMAAAPIDPSIVNFNLLSDDHFNAAFAAVRLTKNQVLSELVDASALYGSSAVADEEVPQSLLMGPVMKEYTDEISDIAGVVVAVLPWDLYFQDILQEGSSSLYVVISDGECGSEFTFEIKGPEVVFLGQGDLHDVQYSDYEITSDFAASATANSQICSYSLHVYPSADLHQEFQDEQPFIWTIFVACIFVFMIVVFFVYDCFVETRQNKVLDSAAKSNAIVSALFPAEIRDRLFGNDNNIGGPKQSSTFFKNMPESSKYKLKNYLAEENGQTTNNDEEANGKNKKPFKAGSITEADVYDTKPIADLFPNTTVMFADIAGFTAWSSVREPSQVFTLLETVYHAFDVIAKRRRVFKVETVGDCYVAVTGLPEARKDHAVAMAKFARECLEKFNQLTKQLEITLGPDTGDLAMRAGLHSGPVTAGVLRGDKSRFQLFGETVNTAAKIENLGQRNRVHLSSYTAELLKAGGKELWVTKRNGTVSYRGKGEMQTYWLQSPHDAASGNVVEEDTGNEPKNAHTLGDASIDELDASLSPKIQRLVHWNVEILKKLLQQIIAKKNAVGNRKNFEQQLTKMEADILRRKNCLSEVIQIIPLPKFDVKAHKNQENANKIEIPQKVVEQLRLFVSSVAAMHRDNPFHNFEHASHVTMSVSKLLSRIVAPDEVLNQDVENDESENMASSLHDHTYGITSDPLTHFAVVVSALIHDTDHAGVSNFQLIQENHKMAKFFNKKSVAEQNSIVLAWEKLMSPRFTELRRCVYSTPSELNRFRQLVVNNVLATDIFDKELQTLRRNRWDKAFQKFQPRTAGDSPEDDINRKATIVMEHLIQASDVAHTMQHWHIYHKWNERLFAEMTVAYQNGRMDKDPAEGWYQGELGFLDNYIIPLAKKLKECGVFGVSSDEYLNYALENRREWASKGEEVVAKYAEKFSKKKEEVSKPSGETKSSSICEEPSTESSQTTSEA